MQKEKVKSVNKNDIMFELNIMHVYVALIFIFCRRFVLIAIGTLVCVCVGLSALDSAVAVGAACRNRHAELWNSVSLGQKLFA